MIGLMEKSGYSPSVRWIINASLLIAIASIASFLSLDPFSRLASAEGTGSLIVRIVHGDGTPADVDDFFVPFKQEQSGFYGLYDDAGNLTGTFPICDDSGSSCGSTEIPVGNYSASVWLGVPTFLGIVNLEEYQETVSIEEGTTTEVAFVVDYGYVELTVIQLEENQELDPQKFISEYSQVEGYISLYDDEGNFMADAESCNLNGIGSCIIPLRAGIYEARATNIDGSRLYTIPFEVVDGLTSQPTIIVESSTSQDDGSTDGDSNPNDDNGAGSVDNGSTSGSTSGAGTGGLLSSLLRSQGEPVGLIDYTHYIDPSDGTYHVVGEVLNTGRNPVKEVTIYGIFYEDKEVIFAKRGYSIKQLIGPGERSPFEIEIRDPSIADSITNFTLTAPSSEPALKGKREYLGVNVTKQYYDNSTGLYHVQGVVSNYADFPAHFVKVAISIYNQNNSLIYVASKYAISSLDDGVPYHLDISFAPVNVTQIARISASVESEEYSMVKAGFLESPITLTLDSSTYRSGMSIIANGTIGVPLSDHSFAIIDILWPDGILNDRQTARVLSDGSYRTYIQFFSSLEFEGETFTVRVSYGKYYAEEVFVFVH